MLINIVLTIICKVIFLFQASSMQLLSSRCCLYAHGASVTGLSLCRSFSVLVSASQDGTLAIWDLNRLCYVRSIRDHQAPVVALAVSDTLGDIVSASTSGRSYLHIVKLR